MSESNKAIVGRFYESVNAGELGAIDDVISDDFVEHDEFPGMEQSKAGVRKFFETLRAAFPDLKMDAEDMIAEGDKVFVRATMTGTHQGEFMGMAATGRKITVPIGDYIRFDNGKVVEHWGVTDTGAMMQQLTEG